MATHLRNGILLTLLIGAGLGACGGGSASGGAGGTGSSSASTGGSPSSSSGGVSVSACTSPAGRVLEVGPGKPYALPSQAAGVAQAGDTIRIAGGDYTGDVTTWSAPNLTICGVGGRARLFAAGKSAAGKGIWVAAGTNLVVENISFHDAKVVDKNGAGIRVEPGVNLTVRDSGFYDNENGILAGNSGGVIVIERSEFARNGHGDGYSHNLYIGRVDSLTVRASFFHEAKIGHNLKSRAKISLIENSYFMDGPTGTSSYLADFPNGGAVLLRGNLFHKGPLADNSNAISFGAEGLGVWSTNTLDMFHNTVVSTYPGGAFIHANAATQALRLTANLFAGTNGPTLITGGLNSGSVVVQQQNTVVTVASNLPGAAQVANPSFWPQASLLGSLLLSGVADAQYVQDSPAPYRVRPLSGVTRLAGALQSAP